MKILAAGDIHNNEKFIKKLVSEANSGKYELFIGLGDYDKVSTYEKLNKEIKIAKIFSTGNWDFGFQPPGNNEYPNLFNFMRVDFKAKDDVFKVIVLGGVFPDNYRTQILDWIGDFPKQKIIFASHYPPYMLRDLAKPFGGIRAGLSEFRELIIRLKPALWLCAHIHEDNGIARFMRTTIVNASIDEIHKAYSVEITNEGVKKIEEIAMK